LIDERADFVTGPIIWGALQFAPDAEQLRIPHPFGVHAGQAAPVQPATATEQMMKIGA